MSGKRSAAHLAADILQNITKDGGHSGIALKKALSASGADRRTRGLCTNLVYTTLRNIRYIDYHIDAVAGVKTTKMKPFIASLLRVSVCRLLFMDNSPNHAVCFEAAEIAGARGFGSLRGFVNGVLRSLIRNIGEIRLPDKTQFTEKYLGIKYSCPEWLINRLVSEFGGDFEKTEAILQICGRPAKVTVCVNPAKTTAVELAAALEAEGVRTAVTELPNCLEISKTDDIAGLSAFKSGLFHVMDKGAVSTAMLLYERLRERGGGLTIIDLCAAPGGKSFLLGGLLGDRARISARDIHEHKIEIIRQGAERLGLSSVGALLADAARTDESLTETADAVVADLPCSGLGLIRRKPDIRLKKTMEDIPRLAELQREILGASAGYVKRGGFLLYSTCTLTREENEDNAEWFLENFDFEAAAPFSRITPDMMDSDGFFAALFRRR